MNLPIRNTEFTMPVQWQGFHGCEPREATFVAVTADERTLALRLIRVKGDAVSFGRRDCVLFCQPVEAWEEQAAAFVMQQSADPNPWPEGWQLVSEDEDDGDCVKRDFWLIGPDGKKHLLDVSPYRRNVPAHIVSMMVDMGIPERVAFGTVCPLTDELIEARWREWAARQASHTPIAAE